MQTQTKRSPMTRLLSFAASCTLAISALPALPAINADAAGDTFDLWVAGTEVTSANKDDILGDGVFHYDPETDTLHVHGSYTGSGPIINRYGNQYDATPFDDQMLNNADYLGFTVCVDSQSTLTATSGYCIEIGHFCYMMKHNLAKPYKKLMITGEKLNLRGAGGIHAEQIEYTDEDLIFTAAVSIENTDVDIQTSGAGIYSFVPNLPNYDDENLVYEDYFGPVQLKNSDLYVKSDTEAIRGRINMTNSILTKPDDVTSPDEGYLKPNGTRAKELRFQKAITYPLTINNKRVHEFNLDDILGDGVFRYDPDTKTLQISGDLTATDSASAISSYVSGLTIETVQDSTLTADNTIVLGTDTVLTGSGKLTLRTKDLMSDKKSCIHLSGTRNKLTIRNAELDISGPNGITSVDYPGYDLEIINSDIHARAVYQSLDRIAEDYYGTSEDPDSRLVNAIRTSGSILLIGSKVTGPEGVSLTGNHFTAGTTYSGDQHANEVIIERDGTMTEDGSGAALSTDGTLFLYGNVTKKQIQAFRENSEVNRVIAADGCVLPANCSEMFTSLDEEFDHRYWRSMTSMDLSAADTSNVTNMQKMFEGCSKLTFLNISNFDTSNVTDMSGMFSKCFHLNYLNLCSFDTSNVTNMSKMFNECVELTTIDVTGKWNTDSVTSSAGMFTDCCLITGGSGTTFDSSETDKTYARIDKPGKPGYLSAVYYNVQIGGIAVTSENYDDILGNGVFSYDPSTNTLTVNKGYSISKAPRDYNTENLIVCNRPGMTINVPANVSLTSDYATILVNADITITGNGKLMLTSTCGPAIEIADGQTLTVKNTNADFYSQVTHAIAGSSQSTAKLIVENSDVTARTEGVAAVNRLGSLTLRESLYSNPADGVFKNTSVYSEAMNKPATYLKIARTNPTKPIREEYVTLSKTEFPYTGSAVKFDNYLIVKDGNTSLKYGTDFTLSYANNVNCGVNTASVTVTGIGGYTGTVTKYFTIVPAQQAKPTLTYKDGKLNAAWSQDSNAEGYQVMYSKSSKFSSYNLKAYATKTSCVLDEPAAGEKWYVRVRSYIKDSDGKKHGIWSESSELTLVDPITSVSLSKSTFPYTGKAVKVGSYITVKSGDTKLKYGDDFTLTYSENIECGVSTAKVTVKGTGKYTGTITKKYTIVPAQQAKPTLTVKNGKLNAVWTKDTNAQGYQVQYSKDSSFSSYKLLAYATKTTCELPEPELGEKWYVRVRSYIKGSDGKKYGIWSESSVKTLTLPIDSVTLSKSSFAYTGSQVKVGSYITVKSGDTKLKYGTDFTLTYSENVECGVNTAKVTATGTGKYSGTISKTYTIYPAQQAAPKLSTVSGKLHAAWTKDTNAQGYQVQYCQNKDFTGDTLHSSSFAATATNGDLKYGTSGSLWYVRVRAYITSSSGTKYGEWSVVSSLKVGKLSTVTLSQSIFTYTGNPIKVGSYITVKSGNTKLKYGTDFTLSYKNNTAKGTATVTVTGIGEYSGTLSKNYTIQ